MANSAIASTLFLSCVVGCSILASGVEASPLASDAAVNIGDGTVQVTFVPPNGDAPRETRGGAARDSSCLQTEETTSSLTALVPQSNHGLTTQNHPVFMVYSPSVPTGAIFFSLKDEQGQSVYETFLPVQDNSGIIAVELPQDAPPLAVGKNYEWGVAVPCAARLRPDSPFVSGWVQRVESDKAELVSSESHSALEQASQYGQDGIWYDMLALLATLNEASPDSQGVNNNWQTVLQSSSLGEIDSSN